MRKSCVLLAVLWIAQALFAANTGIATSPDGQLVMNYKMTDKFTFSVLFHQQQVLNAVEAAMTLDDGTLLPKGSWKKVRTEQNRFTTAATHYRKSQIDLTYTTLWVSWAYCSLEFRLYNNGIAYRFVTQARDSINVADETARFGLPNDFSVYAAPANSRVKSDDFRVQTFCSFENTYVHAPLSQISRTHLSMAPVLVDLPKGGKMLLGEYNVRDYPGMFFLPDEEGALKAYFPQLPKREHQGGHNNLQLLIDEWYPYIARTAGKRQFPWRMILLAENDAQMLDCDIPYTLADTPEVDGSWVRPGKVAWDWWNDWNLKGVDFKAGVNNETYEYYIDFASQHGIEYVILDEGWAVNKQADLMQVVPEIDLERLVRYANQRNVGLVLWAGYKAFVRDMEAVCKHYSQMGIKGFKIDFMDRNDQKVMRFLEDAARMCAKYHLFCDFHGAPVPQGLTITFPNVLNFEAVYGMEQLKWASAEQFDEVHHETILPFIRQVVGPMDYTQGAMRNCNRGSYHPNWSRPMSQGTRARQLALYMILESPFNMLCDSPTNYEANPQCTDFIAQLPVTWDETRVLMAEMEQCIVMARRKGDTWYLGGITNWDSRDLTLDLSFLAGKTMTLVTDGPNVEKNAEDYQYKSVKVGSTLNIHMASGGGFAAIVN